MHYTVVSTKSHRTKHYKSPSQNNCSSGWNGWNFQSLLFLCKICLASHKAYPNEKLGSQKVLLPPIACGVGSCHLRKRLIFPVHWSFLCPTWAMIGTNEPYSQMYPALKTCWLPLKTPITNHLFYFQNLHKKKNTDKPSKCPQPLEQYHSQLISKWQLNISLWLSYFMRTFLMSSMYNM